MEQWLPLCLEGSSVLVALCSLYYSSDCATVRSTVLDLVPNNWSESWLVKRRLHSRGFGRARRVQGASVDGFSTAVYGRGSRNGGVER